ncbi:MAG: acyl--CoA ligase, partial [Actinobacteria bacterium]|nr:acyl--CoA ligase [Actinomycetota bacterium]
MIHHYLAARAELDAPGSPFATKVTEVRGVMLKEFASSPPTMRALWEASAVHGDKPYLVYEDEHMTYAEAHAQVRKLAAHLVANGVHPGSRVAIAMRNYPEWVVSHWAAMCVGAAVVGVNAWWTPPEIEYALNDSEPAVFIADNERLERLNHMPEQRPMHIISVRSSRVVSDNSITWNDAMTAADAGTLPAVAIDPDDDATIFYTSGTTGFPKGAQLTHRGSVNNVYNIMTMGLATNMAEQRALAAGDVAPRPTASTPTASPPAQAAFMAATPLFHVTACNCVLQGATVLGGKVVLMHKWDPGRALELIERERVTNFTGVPTMSRELLMHPDWSRRDTSTLQGMGGGGAPLQPDLVGKIADALEAGQPSTAYGMTETCGIITANSARWFLAKPASCGTIVPTLEAKLVDENGNDLAPSPTTTGVLCVRGSVVIKGYLNRPEATADAIRDGWLNTGDIA